MVTVEMEMLRTVGGICLPVVALLLFHSWFVACMRNSILSMLSHLPFAVVRPSSVVIPSIFVCVGLILPIGDRPHCRSHCHYCHFHTVRVAAVCHLQNSSPNLAGDLC